MTEDRTGAIAYGVMFDRYGFCKVHRFVPHDADEQQCRHCDGLPYNIIHWSI